MNGLICAGKKISLMQLLMLPGVENVADKYVQECPELTSDLRHPGQHHAVPHAGPVGSVM